MTQPDKLEMGKTCLVYFFPLEFHLKFICMYCSRRLSLSEVRSSLMLMQSDSNWHPVDEKLQKYFNRNWITIVLNVLTESAVKTKQQRRKSFWNWTSPASKHIRNKNHRATLETQVLNSAIEMSNVFLKFISSNR